MSQPIRVDETSQAPTLRSEGAPRAAVGSPQEETQPGHARGRDGMRLWLERTRENVYTQHADFVHTLRFHLGDGFEGIQEDLVRFGELVPGRLDQLVAENDFRPNHPRIEHYDGIGDRDDRVVHHASYALAGDVIYGSDVVRRLARRGGLREGHAFYFLSNHAGDTGHNCPVICNFETVRVLRSLPDFPDRDEFVERLEVPSYSENMTASQFLTEVQGGSDVGANATLARPDADGTWRIRGEKWFCSNADADLQVISARYDEGQAGTRGLAMFLVPARKPDGSRNDFTLRRLKEKIGTRALASAEIDYHDAFALALGPVDVGFHNLLTQQIHHSRLALAVGVLGMASRAYQLARAYADTREAFGSKIIAYPLVQENLAGIRADLTVGLAGTYALLALQDDIDVGAETRASRVAFTRLMANIGKNVVSQRAVDMVHHAADTLAGNGMIETTSAMPRLYRDVTTWENWEGSHNTLRIQVLRDIEKYDHDAAYLEVVGEIVRDLPAPGGERGIAAKALEGARRELTALREASPELKTLRMPRVLEAMADAFYYASAVREGADQLRTTGDSSKLAAADLYRRTRLEAAPAGPDEEYLALIPRVIGARSME